jgi:NAD(P)-dependent dehydrogenase (short-subunit alcohol dehydrogenase family)
MQKAVVITGASTGIGEASALMLDRAGWRVFAGVRRAEDGEALRRKASKRLTPVMLEITSSVSIAAAAEQVATALGDGGLAGLVNNAGIAVASPLEFIPIDELRRQLEVNVTGQIAVTQAFLPMLRTSRGRIVNIGSVSGRLPFPLLGPYCASKFALEALTGSLRMELRPWGIHVAVIEAGGIATPIWDKALAAGEDLAKRLPPQTQDLYGPIIAGQRNRAIRSSKMGVPPSHVARAVVHALTAGKPKRRYVIGRSARLGELLLLLPESAREGLIAFAMRRA